MNYLHSEPDQLYKISLSAYNEIGDGPSVLRDVQTLKRKIISSNQKNPIKTYKIYLAGETETYESSEYEEKLKLTVKVDPISSHTVKVKFQLDTMKNSENSPTPNGRYIFE